MPFTVNSFAVFDEHSEVKPYKLERRDPKPDDVIVSIKYTGVCHSDIHTSRNDWHSAHYPMVTGHEIVGIVDYIGPEVTKHKVGDIVAVGCLVDSCGNCEQCDQHHEAFCLEGADFTYNLLERRFPGHYTAGGYSERIVVPEHFTLKVPKALQDPELLPGVAPILCAGTATYSPLRQFNVGKGTKVAFVALGGLGHMGAKIAMALGAEVTAILRSHDEDELAHSLGIRNVVCMNSAEELQLNRRRFDLIVDTVPCDHDINILLPLVKSYGTLCILGHIGELSKNLNTECLITENKRLAGSFVGNISDTQELLELCAEHKIVSNHKVINMEEVNRAWNEITKVGVNYRFVIDIDKFRKDQTEASA